ncbi:hypothetical protein M2271_005882 [Streptomyces sp. LBL]|uniref:hypothetical protein n=1 Tax=Streptomyces sp. LBL TaxID=2940562 RepID=UPI0024741946|nr:hypothetical protein [Streptomyces sp. LBL]MDH6628052.1 hypothetical protein [Streptomyces sp. LBL]
MNRVDVRLTVMAGGEARDTALVPARFVGGGARDTALLPARSFALQAKPRPLPCSAGVRFLPGLKAGASSKETR